MTKTKKYARKEFELAAAIIASVASADTRKVLCEEWSLKLAKTNQKFNYRTFAEACDVSEGELSFKLYDVVEALSEAVGPLEAVKQGLIEQMAAIKASTKANRQMDRTLLGSIK